MTIELREKQSRDYYKEQVCVSRQYKEILKDSHATIKDRVPTYKKVSILGLVLAIIFAVLFAFNTGVSQVAFMILACVFALIFVMSRILIKANDRVLEAHETNHSPAVFTLNDSGVTLDKEEGFFREITWDNLLSVMVGNYTMIFVPKKNASFIVLPVDYKDQVLSAMQESAGKDVEVISFHVSK